MRGASGVYPSPCATVSYAGSIDGICLKCAYIVPMSQLLRHRMNTEHFKLLVGMTGFEPATP